ncbi:MAG: hypothetical protein GDA52_09365 [Rhodobacteraceae bacterium]|nr:hypothetical protein [Paracoccaceae bacterium]
MDILIWSGALLTVLGVIAIGYCIAVTISAKCGSLSDDEMRTRLQRVVPINMGAVLVSVLGLMGVVIGVILGG